MKLRLFKLFAFLLAIARTTPCCSQEKPAPITTTTDLLEHIEDLRATTLPCIAPLTFSGRDASLGEYAHFFRTTPCDEAGDTATVDGEPCLFSEMACRTGASEITVARFDSAYQEGGHTGPAEHFPFRKSGKDYFVVLYNWPVKHYAVEGAFYGARIYRIEPGGHVRIWKNDWLFREEYDGYAEGRTARAKYKTRSAIAGKLQSADLEKPPRRKR